MTVPYDPDAISLPGYAVSVAPADRVGFAAPAPGGGRRDTPLPDGRVASVFWTGGVTAPACTDGQRWTVLVFGKADADDVGESDNFDALLRRLDGQWLMIAIDRQRGDVCIASDRFASFPLYYVEVTGGFYAASNFLSLARVDAVRDGLHWRAESAYEFCRLRRLHGARTLAEGVWFLEAASSLRVTAGGVRRSQYWRPDYTKRFERLEDAGEALAAALRRSAAACVAEAEAPGLFLSGGMDTRMVLAALPERAIQTFTLGFRPDTREIEVARRLAKLRGFRHDSLIVPAEHFARIFEAAGDQAAGHYHINSIFLGFQKALRPRLDAALCGIGLDYMFQGMYYPAKHLTILGKKLKWKTPIHPEQSVVDAYTNRIGFRVKLPAEEQPVRDEMRVRMEESLRETLAERIEAVSDLTDDYFDLWHALFLGTPSRHYSYPDGLSIGVNAPLKIPAFSNDILDICHAAPHQFRFDARLSRAAIRALDARFLQVPSANDGLLPRDSRVQTPFQLLEIASRKMKPKREEHELRTFPTHDFLLRNERELRMRCRAMKSCEALDTLEWLDKDALGALIDRWEQLDPREASSPQIADYLWVLMSLTHCLQRLV